MRCYGKDDYCRKLNKNHTDNLLPLKMLPCTFPDCQSSSFISVFCSLIHSYLGLGYLVMRVSRTKVQNVHVIKTNVAKQCYFQLE